MCIPKRTPAQQARHEATMRAINRGKRNHPRHHNNFRPIHLAACVAVALLAASVVSAAAFFTQPTPAAPPDTTNLPRSIP